MNKGRLISAICFLLCMGCVEIEDQSQKAKVTAGVSKISYEIRGLLQPQSYLVRFSGVDCNQPLRRSGADLKQIQIQLQNCEDVVNEKGSINYTFSKGPEVTEINVQIPEDIVVQGAISLSALNFREEIEHGIKWKRLSVVGRIYFMRGSRLLTNGENISIESQDLVGEGGEIVTWPEGSQAKFAENGMSGGRINVEVKRWQGVLKVVLRGQKGGDGENIFLSRKKVNELNLNGGHGGNSGQLTLKVQEMIPGSLILESIPGEAGEGVEVKSSCVFMGESCRPRTLRPKGNSGQPGMKEVSCLMVNNQCEPIL